MEKSVTYFDMAEEDYQFLKYCYLAHQVGNAMCYISQNVCERYLKHLISLYCRKMDTTSVLRTHSLNVLIKFLRKYLPDFEADYQTIRGADGYYFSTRYPGEDSFIVDEEDVEYCWRAVTVTRQAVMDYVQTHQPETVSILE